jgi:hypothetical protein
MIVNAAVCLDVTQQNLVHIYRLLDKSDICETSIKFYTVTLRHGAQGGKINKTFLKEVSFIFYLNVQTGTERISPRIWTFK